MLPVQKGQLYIDGIEIEKLSNRELAIVRNQKLGFIFQQVHLLPRTNVLENILLPTKYPCDFATQKKEDVKKAIEYAKKLEIDHRLHHFPNKLSGGEQQRVAIARALVRGAKIIFADEPTGNLDSRLSEQVLKYLIELKQEENLTVVMVTHDDDTATKAEKILHIYDGKIKEITNNNRKYKQTKKEEIKSITTKKKIINSKQSIFRPLKIISRLIPLAFKNILRNKARSLLTVLGIVIGIAAILATVTLGQFTKNKILASYTTLGTNTLAISGYSNWGLRATDKVNIMFKSFDVDHDIMPLKKIFPDIEKLTPVLSMWDVQVNYAGKNVTNKCKLLGVGKDYTNITEKKVKLGKTFSSNDVKQANNVCLIGSAVAKQLFPKQDPLGKIINLEYNKNHSNCTITGVLTKHSSNAIEDASDQNLQVIIPYTTFRKINYSGWNNRIYKFLAKIKDVQDVQAVGMAIKNYFSAKYGISGAFIIDPDILLLSQMRKFLGLFTMMLTAVSLISLIVGGIGITDMMLVAISEQFKEIGLRKAFGATDSDMQMQFLIETIIICCLAGIIGLFFGFIAYEGIIYGASKVIKDLHFEWVFSPLAITLSVFSILSVGILSGIYPALKAKSLEIVTALRSE